MMSFGALSFLSPWLLAGLAALPIIYWLLRTVPPRPRRISFPGTRILVGLENPEKTPDKTPWWLMLIRMLAAALVILALAQPILNPDRQLSLGGSGPVIIAIDNGWSSGAEWSERQTMLEQILQTAEANNRPVLLVETAGIEANTNLQIESPAVALRRAGAVVPQPFAPDRMTALEVIRGRLAGQDGVHAVWLSDGLDHGHAADFAQGLLTIASAGLTVVAPGEENAILAVSAQLGSEGRLIARVVRAFGGRTEGILHALSARGEILGESRFSFNPGQMELTTTFDLPLELRNQVTRIIVSGSQSAGTTHLLDAGSRWNRVGLVSGVSQEQSQPLLSPLHYIRRALRPFAEMVEPKTASADEGVGSVLKQNATILMLADIGTLSQDVTKRVTSWIEKGGVLVRFAGPRLEQATDTLLPVSLRIGGRTLGGALSWSEPQSLAPFSDTSLFAGLDIPADVRVSRQVLADPAALTSNVGVWARLVDGTPLVTARKLGEGHVILFHVTANSDWSNLPLSGLFVEMLRRIATLGTSAAAEISDDGVTTAASDTAETTGAEDETVLAPTQVLDGFGQLVTPPPTAKAIARIAVATEQPSRTHPPGYYGAGERARALNIARSDTVLTPHGPPHSGATAASYGKEAQTDLKPWCLGLALALLLVDVLAVLAIQFGGFAGLRTAHQARTSAATLALLATLGMLAIASDATGVLAQQAPSAQPPEMPPGALAATSRVTFGYVMTGDSSIDVASKAGLEGLVKVLTSRTSVEPGPPMPVNIKTDEIAFFPILYWPVHAQVAELDSPTLAKVDAYMKRGGMIIFDTQDYGQGLPMRLRQRGGDRDLPLQRLLGKLDIPPLEPVPEDHVLTKSFYLLRNFPGRWDGGELWVEAAVREPMGGRQARRADGVSSILITANDFASAWALDENNLPMFPVVPGGERQREWAFRTGVNIVMYALTGNYKADQVHVPSLLQRLGQ